MNKIENNFLLLYITLGFLTIGFVLPLEKTFYSCIKLYKQLNITLITIKTNNSQLIESELEKTNQDLKEVKDNLEKLSYLVYVPLLKNYYVDLLHQKNSTEYILIAWKLLNNHVEKEDISSAPFYGEIRNSILYSDKQYVKSKEAQKNFLLATQELEAIDVSYYPRFIFGTTIEEQIKKAKKFLQENS